MFEKQRIGEIVSQLATLRYPKHHKLTHWEMRKQDGESRPYPNDTIDGWHTITDEAVWGGHCEFYAFRGCAEIPEEFENQCVEFSLLTGREGQWDATNPQFSVYINGQLRQGFDVNHHDIMLSPCATPKAQFEIFLSAFTGTQNFHLQFQPELRVLDQKVEQLYYDLLVPWQIVSLLEENESAYITLISVLTNAINLLDLRKPYSDAFYRSLATAQAYLTAALYSERREAEATVYCVGHSHIDVAWLWTLAVTKDKSVRSFSTVLELMKQYPEYKFMASQPQLYQYVKENAPDIYEKIKEQVANGRWETEGGMFLEPDCNLASGESLVRQLLYGKRFFRKEFNTDCKILWLPDVFGYSAALPQIMKKTGIQYFMTTKISWNECNKMPYDSFYWKGIDGSKVLTHFIPTRNYVFPNGASSGPEEFHTFNTTYNGEIHPRHIKGAWQRYQQKNLNRYILCSYGHGDGGGGPTKQMLETQRRLSYGLPGCPKTKQASTLEFFQKLDRDLVDQPVPTWSGELYLEYHRGTYTSMARNKKWNRRGEFALTNVETEGLAAKQLYGENYPELAECWEILLRNQFHDILPGSSIYEVYEDSKLEYQHLFETVHALETNYLDGIARRVGKTIVWNPNGQTMSGLVTLSGSDGRKNIQQTSDGMYLAWAEHVPAKGYCVLPDTAPNWDPMFLSTETAENAYYCIRFNDAGQITSWYDKIAQREVLQSGKFGNVLMTYEDKPFQYDNWNLQDYYREKSWPVEQLLCAEVVETGPYRYALKLVWAYQDTTIQETLYFYPHTSQVDIHFETDWKEDQILLKALFPVELNTSEATFEIQYGNVKRSTAVNTSWDQARFEVCHHKWMDVAEGNYGVSFLNDCKYGVSILENVVGLSLLKSGTYPNPMADREHHEAVYSIYPHLGTWKEAGTVQRAYLLNNPFKAYGCGNGTGELPDSYAMVSHTHRNIMVESIKKAEDSNAWIYRLYEFENSRTNAALQLPANAKKIWLCNMLENPEKLLGTDTSKISVLMEPFAIETIMVEF